MARGLDHLVVAVRDLDAAARFYAALGFQVGARNRHPWGTENRLVQFPGSFIELITTGEGGEIVPHGAGRFSFGAFVSDYLAEREGLAMLVLDSRDAAEDAQLFAQAGIGAFEPFFFERHGRRPDGSETQVAFTLAFARDPEAPGVGFFVCQQHYPENFWNPAFQQHPNGATALVGAAMAAPDPERHRGFLAAFTGAEPTSPSGADLSFRLSRGRLDVTTPDDAAEAYGSVDVDPQRACLVAFSVEVPDIKRQAGALSAEGIPFQRFGTRLVVPSSAAFGVAIAFDPPVTG
jgi:catechol 2,3-dioxygenase-like lactoylglutathione lyase family enzyme